MNRIILTGILTMGLLLQTYSQDTTFFFFNKNWESTKQKKAEFVRKEIKLVDSYILEISNIDGNPIYKGEYSSLYPEISNGVSIYYGENGKVVERGYFNNGYPDSLWFVINHITGVQDTLNYIGIKDIIKSLEDESSFTETFVIVEEMPSFPCPNDSTSGRTYVDFREFIKSESYYPKLAQQRKNQGSISVTFTIGPDGNIYDIILLKPKNKYFDYEAVRVIRNSPMWKSGMQKGKPVPVRMRTWVGFYLE